MLEAVLFVVPNDLVESFASGGPTFGRSCLRLRPEAGMRSVFHYSKSLDRQRHHLGAP